MEIIPGGQTLGARIEGIDLGEPLSDGDFRTLLRALGQYGVLCFPRQTFDTPAFAAFARRFGDLEVNVAFSNVSGLFMGNPRAQKCGPILAIDGFDLQM